MPPLTTTTSGNGSDVDLNVSDGGGGGLVSYVTDVFACWDPKALKLESWSPGAGAIVTDSTILWPKQSIPATPQGSHFILTFSCREGAANLQKIFTMAADPVKAECSTAEFNFACPLVAASTYDPVANP